MSPRARKISLKGTVESRDAASGLLSSPGDTVLVVRGEPRLAVMRCPCGCGDDLLINLDPRVGPAWHVYGKKRISLYPSYWRDSACGSHFILWSDRIYWCHGWEGDESDEWSVDKDVEEAVLAAMPEDHFVTYGDLAEQLDLIPWEVLQACRQLVADGKASKRWKKGEYRRTSSEHQES